jgi:hypothetical protein
MAGPTASCSAGGRHHRQPISGFASTGLGNRGGRPRRMTGPTETDRQPAPNSEVSASLAEYADRLLLSTGLHVEDALLIANGQLEPPPELEPLARALRTGWETTDQR